MSIIKLYSSFELPCEFLLLESSYLLSNAVVAVAVLSGIGNSLNTERANSTDRAKSTPEERAN